MSDEDADRMGWAIVVLTLVAALLAVLSACASPTEIPLCYDATIWTHIDTIAPGVYEVVQDSVTWAPAEVCDKVHIR